MNADDMRRNWDEWARNDAMWSVLTSPDKRGNQWDPDAFFATGEDVISCEMEILRGMRMAPSAEGRALDFGCGLGRLTNAIAGHVRLAQGVDISEEMVRKARELVRRPGKVEFVHNPRSDLSAFDGGAYDLVYSDITLQHIPTEIQARYLCDFLRLLKPGGVARFQTVRAIGWRSWIPNRLVEIYRGWKHRGRAFLPNYGISRRRIARIAFGGGGEIVLQRTFPPNSGNRHFLCDVYWIHKR